MKITRNKIIIIVCILLVVLLIYLNRKNLQELFFDNFLLSDSPANTKHGYTIDGNKFLPIVSENTSKYTFTKEVNGLKTISNDLVAFQHRIDYDNLFTESTLVDKTESYKYTFIHKTEVGYMNCKFANDTANNSDHYTEFKKYLETGSLDALAYINDISLRYDINSSNQNSNSFKKSSNSFKKSTESENGTIVNYIPKTLQDGYIKCSIIQLKEGALNKHLHTFPQNENYKYKIYSDDIYIGPITTTPTLKGLKAKLGDPTYYKLEANDTNFSDTLLKEITEGEKTFVTYYKIDQNKLLKIANNTVANIFDINIFDNGDICKEIIENAKSDLGFSAGQILINLEFFINFEGKGTGDYIQYETGLFTNGDKSYLKIDNNINSSGGRRLLYDFEKSSKWSGPSFTIDNPQNNKNNNLINIYSVYNINSSGDITILNENDEEIQGQPNITFQININQDSTDLEAEFTTINESLNDISPIEKVIGPITSFLGKYLDDITDIANIEANLDLRPFENIENINIMLGTGNNDDPLEENIFNINMSIVSEQLGANGGYFLEGLKYYLNWEIQNANIEDKLNMEYVKTVASTYTDISNIQTEIDKVLNIKYLDSITTTVQTTITEKELIIPLVFPGFEVWDNFFREDTSNDAKDIVGKELEDISYIIFPLKKKTEIDQQAYINLDNSNKYISNLFDIDTPFNPTTFFLGIKSDTDSDVLHDIILPENLNYYNSDPTKTSYKQFMTGEIHKLFTLEAKKLFEVYGKIVQLALRDHFRLMKINLYKLHELCKPNTILLAKYFTDNDKTDEVVKNEILNNLYTAQGNILNKIEKILEKVYTNIPNSNDRLAKLRKLFGNNRIILRESIFKKDLKIYKFVSVQTTYYKSWSKALLYKTALTNIMIYSIKENNKVYIPYYKDKLKNDKKIATQARILDNLIVKINQLKGSKENLSTLIPSIKYFHFLPKTPYQLVIPEQGDLIDIGEPENDISITYGCKITFIYTNGNTTKNYYLLINNLTGPKTITLNNSVTKSSEQYTTEFNAIKIKANEKDELGSGGLLVRLEDIQFDLVKIINSSTNAEIEGVRIKNNDAEEKISIGDLYVDFSIYNKTDKYCLFKRIKDYQEEIVETNDTKCAKNLKQCQIFISPDGNLHNHEHLAPGECKDCSEEKCTIENFDVGLKTNFEESNEPNEPNDPRESKKSGAGCNNEYADNYNSSHSNSRGCEPKEDLENIIEFIGKLNTGEFTYDKDKFNEIYKNIVTLFTEYNTQFNINYPSPNPASIEDIFSSKENLVKQLNHFKRLKLLIEIKKKETELIQKQQNENSTDIELYDMEKIEITIEKLQKELNDLEIVGMGLRVGKKTVEEAIAAVKDAQAEQAAAAAAAQVAQAAAAAAAATARNNIKDELKLQITDFKTALESKIGEKNQKIQSMLAQLNTIIDNQEDLNTKIGNINTFVTNLQSVLENLKDSIIEGLEPKIKVALEEAIKKSKKHIKEAQAEAAKAEAAKAQAAKEQAEAEAAQAQAAAEKLATERKAQAQAGRPAITPVDEELLTEEFKTEIRRLLNIGNDKEIKEEEDNTGNKIQFTIQDITFEGVSDLNKKKLKEMIKNRIVSTRNIHPDNIFIELSPGSIKVFITIVDDNNMQSSMMKTLRDILEMYKGISDQAVLNSEYDAEKVMRDISLFEHMSKIYERKQGADNDNVKYMRDLLTISNQRMTEILEKMANNKGGNTGGNMGGGNSHTHNFSGGAGGARGAGGAGGEDYSSRPNLPNISQFKPTGTSNIFSPVIDIKTSSPRNNERFADAFKKGFEQASGTKGGEDKSTHSYDIKTKTGDIISTGDVSETGDITQTAIGIGTQTANNAARNKKDRENAKNGGYIRNPPDKDKLGMPGYSYLAPEHWDVPQRRNQVCIPEVELTRGNSALEPAGYLGSGNSNVMEFHGVGSILPKFSYKEEADYVKDNTNRT